MADKAYDIVQSLADLREWEQETGKALPYTPTQITRIESKGGTVDLETGAIVISESDGWVHEMDLGDLIAYFEDML